jgi:hypothetical protein
VAPTHQLVQLNHQQHRDARVYGFVRYFLESVGVPGLAFLASIIAHFSGAQLLSLGIIGEFLTRTHHMTMERPAYRLSETTSPGN